MPSARFNLKNKSQPDKETLIYLIFRYHEKKLKISTGETVLPRYWNYKQQKVREIRSYKKHFDVNERLDEIKKAIETPYRNFQKKGIEPTTSELKRAYLIELTGAPIRQSQGFWAEYEIFIEKEKTRVVKDVIKDYHSLKKHLQGYEKYYSEAMTFNTINFTFYNNFIHFLTYETIKPDGEKGLATNTIGKQIKNLKIFLNYCFKYEIIDKFDLSDFKVLTEEVDKIYLSENEISDIYNLDLSNQPKLEKQRDLFVLGCYTGLRFSDLSRIRPEHVVNEEIRINQSKTNKQVIIPLHDLSKAIVNKHGANLTKSIYSIQFNKNIKLIGRLAGIKDPVIITRKQGPKKIEHTYKKYELMTSHTCRRSFCTNQYLKGIPSYLIMKISGHKTEKSFFRYIRIDEELAAKKIREYWE